MNDEILNTNPHDDDACIVMDALDVIHEEMEKEEIEITEK